LANQKTHPEAAILTMLPKTDEKKEKTTETTGETPTKCLPNGTRMSSSQKKQRSRKPTLTVKKLNSIET